MPTTERDFDLATRIATGYNFQLDDLRHLVQGGFLRRKTIPALTMGDDERDFSYKVIAPIRLQILGKWYGETEIFYDRPGL